MISCIIAALTLSCESVHQQLNSIDDLKTVVFRQEVPRHSLLLLYWFANTIDIDDYGTITVNFDPNTDFGSHYFGNFERMLDLPHTYGGYRYYTVGNLGNDQLPGYLRNPPDRNYQGENRDRIVFSAQRASGGFRINRVYLTQHEPARNVYDPECTYEITLNLLQQIRQFSNVNAMWALRNQFQSNISDSQMTTLRNIWGHLAGLGLLLYIVTQERRSYRAAPQVYNFTQQSGSTRRTEPSYEHRPSSNRGNNEINEECCAWVLAVCMCILFVIFVLFASATQK